MKKQIIAAAVAATMTTVALADVSISGAAQLNWTHQETTTTKATGIDQNMDLKVVGKSGDTTAVMDFEVTNDSADSATTASTGTKIKNAYLTTKVGDVTVEGGTKYGSDSLLDDAGVTDRYVTLSTAVGPATVHYKQWTDDNGTAAADATNDHSEYGVKATFGDITVYHEQETDADHNATQVTGNVAGINLYYRNEDANGTSLDKDALQLDYTMGGVKLTYAKVDAEVGTKSDAFFGTWTTATAASTSLKEADGFGVTTDLAGNTVQLRSYTTKSSASGASDVDHAKIIVTRALASGATAEVTYHDDETTETLDVELRIKF
jgi:hypothetical protein